MSDKSVIVRNKVAHPVTSESMDEITVNDIVYMWDHHNEQYVSLNEYLAGRLVLKQHELEYLKFDFEERWTDEKRMKMFRCLAKDGYQDHIVIIFMIISNSSAHLEKSSRIRIELWKAGYVF